MPKPKQRSNVLCACGCGQYTFINERNRPERNLRAGEPLKFVNGHNRSIGIRPGFPDGVKVDPEDEHWGYTYRWHITTTGYAYARVQRDYEEKTLLLHRVIMGLGDGDEKLVVDHINHDKLDNRRSNLRVVDQVTNGHNRAGLNRNNTSGFRNVCFSRGRWVADIKVNRIKHFIGYFDTPEEANAAVLEWRSKHPQAKLPSQKERINKRDKARSAQSSPKQRSKSSNRSVIGSGDAGAKRRKTTRSRVRKVR